jgi:hypothetical protein
MTRDLPPFLRDLLTSPPRAGEGVHAWLFKVARQLHQHLPASEIVTLLENRLAGCGRHVSRQEIMDAVQNSVSCAWQQTGKGVIVTNRPAANWPSLNNELREAVVSSGGGLADLWECSPRRIVDNRQHTEEIIDRLFPGDPLLCCGASSSVFDTRPREQWRGELTGLQFVVPSPMTALFGRKKNPKPDESEMSAHTLANTGPRRYLVVEFDGGTMDEQAALLLHLAGKGPLVLALHSGGKSLHGWFRAYGTSEEKLLRFFKYAVSLGGDRATWTRSQFCRMPDGRRDNGQRQTIYFFNPALVGGSR